MDYQQKITMLDNLQENDNNYPQSNIKVGRYNGHEMLPPSEADRFKKYIRDEHDVPAESGMMIMNNTQQPFVNYNVNKKNNNSEIYEYQPPEPPSHPLRDHLKKKKKYNCSKISSHIDECKFCNKFYSSDKNIYILFIIFLLFICFLLFKKILSV